MSEQWTKFNEESSKDVENNTDSTYKKCPEMSQLMLEHPLPIKNQELNNDRFSKSFDFHGFQGQKIDDFGNSVGQENAVNMPKEPKYRVIERYVKSKEQYWKERNRRKKAWLMSGQGLTYKQIAEKLGVSEKTILRDIKKIRPYYYRLSRAYFRKLDEQRQNELREKLEGTSISQQLDILMAEWKRYQQFLKQREYNRHMLKIVIDMDDLTYGFPAIRFWPKPPITLRGKPYHFQFHVQQRGKQHYMGEITIG